MALNGMITECKRDGWLWYDRGRPQVRPVVVPDERTLINHLRKAGPWPEREIRPVVAGDIIPLHNWMSYWGFAGESRVMQSEILGITR